MRVGGGFVTLNSSTRAIMQASTTVGVVIGVACIPHYDNSISSPVF